MDLRILLAGVGAVVALVVIAAIPRRLVRPEESFADRASRLSIENEIRRTIVQMLGGGFVLASVFFTYQTVRVSQETLEVTQRGQITERFTRAVDQIGSGKVDVATGGIYALGQLARESRTEHGPIMDILTTYIREHAPLKRSCGGGSGVDPSTLRAERSSVRGDVQAAITVIGGRNADFDDPEDPIDLRNVDLSGGDFSGGNFEGALFTGSCLFEADFDAALLAGARFESVAVTTPSGALGFEPTTITGASFEDAHAEDANFSGVTGLYVNMAGADLRNADLHSATLGPGLDDALTFGSDLSDTDLRGADLRAATLNRADLAGADLRGANLEGATDAELGEAVTDDSTVLP